MNIMQLYMICVTLPCDGMGISSHGLSLRDWHKVADQRLDSRPSAHCTRVTIFNPAMFVASQQSGCGMVYRSDDLNVCTENHII